MAFLALHAGRALTPHVEIPDAILLIEDGRILATGSRAEIRIPAGAKEIHAEDQTVVPGFVDIHIHGAGGHDVMEAGADALAVIASNAARFGTTTLLATTVSAPVEETCRSLEGIARYIRSSHNQRASSAARAEIVGIHLEGPFINHQRRGVHPADAIIPPDISILDRFLSAADGHARVLTLAPELPGALDLISRARTAGLVVAMGHTDATFEQARAAIACGANHAVHVFNAMRPFSHRETGVLGAVLTDPEVTAEIIADGVHVDEPAIRLLLAAKGAARVLLVSDGTAATGMPDGAYRLGPLEVIVQGGVCRNREGRLAGSTLTLDRAIRHMVTLGVPLLDAVRMATFYPARRLGMAGRKGELVPGADADLVLLTQQLNVANVITRGRGFS